MYIPVYHTNGRSIKNNIGVVVNRLVGMGLLGYGISRVLFIISHPNKETFKRSVQFSGCSMWNGLPTATRLMQDYNVFKFHQKKDMNVDL